MPTREEAVLALVTDFRDALGDFDSLHKRWQATIDKIGQTTDQAEIDNLEVQARALADELERAGRDGQAALRKLITAGDLTEEELREATAQAAKLDRELDEIGRSGPKNMQQLGTSVEGVRAGFLAVGGLVAALGLGALAREVVGTANSFDTLRARLEVFEGSKAPQVFERILAFAAKTPFEVDAITDSYVRLRAVGIEPTDRVLNAIGNTAAASGKDILQVTEAVNDAITGEFERLKEFGIVARSEGEQVRFTFQGVTTTVTKGSDEILDYLQQLAESKFAGAMENQAKRLSGAWSNLIDATSQLSDRVGQGGLSEALAEAAREAAALASGGNDAADVLGGVLGASVRTLTSLLKLLLDNAEGVGAALVVLGGAKLVAGIRATVAAIAAMNLSLSATPVGAVAVAVGLLTAAVFKLTEASRIQERAQERANELLKESAARHLDLRDSTYDAIRVRQDHIKALAEEARAEEHLAAAKLASAEAQRDLLRVGAEAAAGNADKVAEFEEQIGRQERVIAAVAKQVGTLREARSAFRDEIVALQVILNRAAEEEEAQLELDKKIDQAGQKELERRREQTAAAVTYAQSLREVTEAKEAEAVAGTGGDFTTFAPGAEQAEQQVASLSQQAETLRKTIEELEGVPLKSAEQVAALFDATDQLAKVEGELAEAMEAAAPIISGGTSLVEDHGETVERTTEFVQDLAREQLELGRITAGQAAAFGVFADEQDRITLATERQPEAFAELTTEIDRTGIAVTDLAGAQVQQLETQGDINASLAGMKERLDVAGAAQLELGRVSEETLAEQVEGYEKLTDAQKLQVEGIVIWRKAMEAEMAKAAQAQVKVIDGWKEMNRLCQEHRECLTK